MIFNVMRWLHVHPAVYCAAFAIDIYLLKRGLPSVLNEALRQLEWMRSRPIKRWIYARRERRWKARQPRPERTPYR